MGQESSPTPGNSVAPQSPVGRPKRARNAPQRLGDEIAPSKRKAPKKLSATSKKKTTQTKPTASKGRGKRKASHTNDDSDINDLNADAPDKNTPDTNSPDVSDPANSSAGDQIINHPIINHPNANYTSTHLLTNKKSLLAKINLYKLVMDDRAWTALSAEQKLKLLELLPNAPQHTPETVEKDIPGLAKQLFKENAAFKSDIKRYQDDLVHGYRDPRWQEQALEAMHERASGKFDDWKEQEIEQWWGQKMNT